MKNLLIAAAVIAAPSAALAGPYVQTEASSSFTGDDYSGSKVETHVGYASDLGDSASWYVQLGPTYLLPDAGEESTELGGKVGIKVKMTDNLSGYGEIKGITQNDMDFDQDIKIGAKVGLRYSF